MNFISTRLIQAQAVLRYRTSVVKYVILATSAPADVLSASSCSTLEYTARGRRWKSVVAENNSVLLNTYLNAVERNQLQRDENQLYVIREMEKLYKKLKYYKNTSSQHNGFFKKLFSQNRHQPTLRERDEARKLSGSPLGMYIHGGVGCGKTMLVDMFHEALDMPQKKRIHFHEFMIDTHNKIHSMKQSMMKGQRSKKLTHYDPIAPVAEDISRHTWVLCFDEFQVTDIADAMILKSLFWHLWRNGVVVIATSNRNPDDLYKNGLQRVNFVPFIPMLKANCDIINLDSIDYRKQNLPLHGKTYFVSSECDPKYEMDSIYEELVSRINAEEGARHLDVLGRTVTFQKTCGRILDAQFDELCKRPVGAVDYLEICQCFDTVLIRDIPRMTLSQRAEARRFITLIDTLYDHRVKVVFSADAPITDLFAKGDISEWDKQHAKVLIGDLNIARGDSNEQASLFTGEEELFAFDRVVSRISEMQTEVYWKQATLPRKHVTS